jgi:hypothetical protein
MGEKPAASPLNCCGMLRFSQNPVVLCRAVVAAVVLACLWIDARGNTLLFFENFEGAPPHPLSPSESYSQIFPNAFSHSPPAGWINDVSGVPTGSGRPEWRGWSFARKGFWNNALVGGGRRQEFQLGQGTVAVADPQEWNELGNPADNLGFFNGALTTPFISLTTPDQGSKKLTFDSSWLPGSCCDDGNGTNNQTAIVRLRYPNGTFDEVLRWEAAPFINSMGVPSPGPAPGFTPNQFFKSPATNERVLIDLTPYLANVTFSQVRLEFLLLNAGDDGWWAYDTARMFSLSLVPGDMNIDGFVDDDDIPAFALGVQSVDSYRDAYFGEFPVTRGSPDSVFDFDDIPWFVSLLDSSGVGGAAAKVQAALAGSTVPEPSSALVISFGILCIAPWRRTRRVSNAVE